MNDSIINGIYDIWAELNDEKEPLKCSTWLKNYLKTSQQKAKSIKPTKYTT